MPSKLQAHVKQCPLAHEKEREELARMFLGRANKQRRATRKVSGEEVDGSASPAGTPGVAYMRGRRPSTGSASPKAGGATPSRRIGSSVGVSPAGGTRGRPARATSAPNPEEALQSSAALLQRGLILAATEEEEAPLRACVLESLPGATLVRAYRIAEGSQRGMYAALRESTRGGAELVDERDLWHGTGWCTVPKILRSGFNRSFAGRHGTRLGMGTYFSSDLSYSVRFCDRQGGGADATKVVLLARVLVGRFCRGEPSLVEPPVLDAETGERYDSTCDNEESPSIFAVFRDFQALPLFLVELRT